MTLADYKFPGVPKPFAHQRTTTEFIVNTPKCFVFNDIGTGKTWSTVWAIDYLMQIGEVRNALIVAPLSTLEIVWKRTFFYLNSMIDVEVLKGTADKRKRLLQRKSLGGKISVINPDALHIIADQCDDVDMVVVDESAMFRNSTSRRVKALAKICRDVPRVVMMTGSPCPEAPTDIYSTARIVCPERMPRYFGQFRDLTMKKISQFKWVALPTAQDTISKLLKGFVIRYRRDECIDLPTSHHAEIEVESSPEQARMICELRKAAMTMFDEGEVVAANEAVVISKILQIASGAVKFINDDGEADVLITDASAKYSAFADILEASTQPVIVYAPYTAVIGAIQKWLDKHNISHAVVTGATTSAKRLESFDALQSGMIRVLVAHPQAMAHGITLTNSNIVIWWTPIFSHEIYEQANGRVVRPGQTRTTYFVHLTCSSLESKVLKRLESKQQLQGVLLEYLQEGIKRNES